MKYIPKDDIEGVNSTPDHPLKEFSILLVGALALVGVAVYFSGSLFGEVAVRMAPRIENFLEKSDIKASFGEDQTLMNNEKLDALLLSVIPSTFSKKKTEVSILCHEEPNAFALPNGKIWVTSTLLDHVVHEKGLAFVLAHELGHIHNKDHIRAFGQSMGFTMIMSILGFAEASSALYKLPAEISYLGLSRNAETEADNFALTTIKKNYSSYNGADEFFDVILKKDTWGEKIPTVLSTHPNTEKRKAAIQALIAPEEKKEKLALHKIEHGCEKK